MYVSEIMTKKVQTIPGSATVGEALDVLSRANFRHLPVIVDGEVQGMFTDRDLRSMGLALVDDVEAIERSRAMLSTRLSTLMSADLISAGPDDDVKELIDVMLEEKIGAVPVIDEETASCAAS